MIGNPYSLNTLTSLTTSYNVTYKHIHVLGTFMHRTFLAFITETSVHCTKKTEEGWGGGGEGGEGRGGEGRGGEGGERGREGRGGEGGEGGEGGREGGTW